MNTHKSRKFLLVIALICGVLLLFYLALSIWAEKKLSELPGEHVEFRNIDVDVFGNNVTFSEPVLVMRETPEKPRRQVQAAARSVQIDGFSLLDLIFGKTLDVEALIVDSLSVTMTRSKEDPSQSGRAEVNLFVKDFFNKIEVEHFRVLNSRLIIRRKEDQKLLYEISQFELSAEHIIVDTANAKSRFPLTFRSSEVSIGSIAASVGDDYILSGKELLIRDTTLWVTDLRLQCLLSKTAFAREHPYEESRFDIAADSLIIRRLLWDTPPDSDLTVSATLAALENLRLTVYKDKNPPMKPPHIDSLLTGMMLALPITLTIDTFLFHNAFIEYQQLPEEEKEPVTVSFEQFYLTAYNITNDSLRIQQRPITTLDVHCRFMGIGKLFTTIELDMLSDRESFKVSGHLEEMTLQPVTPIFKKLVDANATGTIHRLAFDFTGNDYSAEGSVAFEYSDLKITALDDKNEKRWLKSLAGDIVTKDQNLKRDKGFRSGEIFFVRFLNKSYFNYLWNSLRTGLMDTVSPIYSNPDKDRDHSKPKYKEDD